MSEEEAQMIQTMGKDEFAGPGGCNSKESCEAYCSQETNQEECGKFFGDNGKKKNDVEDGEGVEIMENFVGPGGCATKEECEAFCADGANSETCAAFFGTVGKREGEGEFQEESEYETREFEFDQQDREMKQGETKWELTEPSVDEPVFETKEYDPLGQSDFEDRGQWKEGETYEGEFGDKLNVEDWRNEGTNDYDYDFENSQKFDEYKTDFGSGSDFEEFDPGDSGFQFGSPPSGDGYQQFYEGIQVTPGGSVGGEGDGFGGDERGGGGEAGGGMSGGDGGGGTGGEQGLGPAIDAGFVESLKRFFYRASLKARGVLTL